MDNRGLIYDKLINEPLIPKKTYPLNKTNVEKYIAIFKKDHQAVIRQIFDNTQHISYKIFRQTLYSNFEEFIKYCNDNKIQKVYLYFGIGDSYFNKSNFWIAQHFIQYKEEYKIGLNIIIIYDKNDFSLINSDDIILILDDCTYDGVQISNYINKDIPKKKFFGKTLKLYILIQFISENAISKIKSVTSHNIIFSPINNIIKPMEYYLSDAERAILFDYSNELAINTNKNSCYLIYFDHKLANNSYTLASIYRGTIPLRYRNPQNHKNKYIISVITNCEHIKFDNVSSHYDNIEYDMCPPIPYKNENDGMYDNSVFKKYSIDSSEQHVAEEPLKLNDCITMGSIDHQCIDIYKNKNLDIIIKELQRNKIDSYDIIIESLIKHKTQDFTKLRNLLLDDKIKYYQSIIGKLKGSENSIEKLKELIELMELLKRSKEDDFFEGGYKLKRTDIKIKFHFNNNNYTRCILIDNKNKKYVKINGKIVDLQNIK